VERGLPVEDDVVTISQLSLDDVAWGKMSLGAVPLVGEVDLPVVVPDDVFGTRPFGRTVGNKLLHHVHILSRDVLRDSQVHCNGLRHAQLVKLQDGVWRDDRSGREVHSLAHEVTTDSAFLTLEARPDVFDGLAASTLLPWLILDVVVHQRSYEELKLLLDCILGTLWLAVVDAVTELLIGPDDHLVGISEVIYTSGTIACLY
jgi:hypothetical protein